MSAPKNNQFYKIREKDGRNPLYDDPEAFKDKCNEYFVWCEENPLLEELIVNKPWREERHNPDDPKHPIIIVHGHSKDVVAKKRPFTILGLCIYLGMVESTFGEYGRKEDFSMVVTCAREIIKNQKFEGAAAGFFNSNIIARDLGLIDRKDHTTKGKKLGRKVNVTIKRNPE